MEKMTHLLERGKLTQTLRYIYIYFFILESCPQAWMYLKGFCYKFSSQSLTWNAAKTACENMGAMLAVVDSKEKQNGIATKLKGQNHWIGLYRDPETLHVGCGLTGHDLVTVLVTGVQENLITTKADLKVAVRCGPRNPDFGMMKVVRRNAATSAKRRVGAIPLLTKVSLDLTLNMMRKLLHCDHDWLRAGSRVRNFLS